MEIKEKGKNVVVSRRVLLEEEQEKRSKETLERLKPDLVCEGKVTKLADSAPSSISGGSRGWFISLRYLIPESNIHQKFSKWDSR
jgi:hypothetical protein